MPTRYPLLGKLFTKIISNVQEIHTHTLGPKYINKLPKIYISTYDNDFISPHQQYEEDSHKCRNCDSNYHNTKTIIKHYKTMSVAK